MKQGKDPSLLKCILFSSPPAKPTRVLAGRLETGSSVSFAHSLFLMKSKKYKSQSFIKNLASKIAFEVLSNNRLHTAWNSVDDIQREVQGKGSALGAFDFVPFPCSNPIFEKPTKITAVAAAAR